MDVLSGIVEAAKARISIEQVKEHRSAFSEFFPGRSRNVHFIVSGRCLLTMEDDEPPRKLRAGDIVIVASQRNHHLKGEGLSDGTERTRIASGRLSSQELGSDAIYSFLPPVLVTNLFSDAAKEDLAEAVRIGGAFDENAGARVILSRLTELLILMTAHRSVENLPEKVHGWVGALLSDPKIGKALRLIHSDPATDWTVDRLAREVAMSPTSPDGECRSPSICCGPTPPPWPTSPKPRATQRNPPSARPSAGKSASPPPPTARPWARPAGTWKS
jgi:hypothetical protein